MNEKNNNVKIAIIVFFITLFFLTTIIACVCFQRSKLERQESIMYEKMTHNAKKYGYTIESMGEKTFLIDKGIEKYYFNVDKSGIVFESCEFIAEEKNVNVKEGEITIRIRDDEDGCVRVHYHDTRVLLQDDGTEELMYSSSYFVSNKNFDKDSLIIDPYILDDEQKSIDAYNRIMKYTTVEELKKHYNEALDICAELNS